MSKCHKINTLEFKYFNQKRTPTILNKSLFTVVASRIIQSMIERKRSRILEMKGKATEKHTTEARNQFSGNCIGQMERNLRLRCDYTANQVSDFGQIRKLL